MGREIASRQSPYRFWCQQQIDNLKKDSTTFFIQKRKQIRGIQPADALVAFKQYMHRLLMRKSSRQSKRLRFSNELRILFVKRNEFTEEFASLSEELVWLHWEGQCRSSFAIARAYFKGLQKIGMASKLNKTSSASEKDRRIPKLCRFGFPKQVCNVGLPQSREIQGWEHAKSLKIVTTETHWRVPIYKGEGISRVHTDKVEV
ncbi:hypothetical protein SUGI_0292310 [Cryptomeria japonica]|nr:hypothetical protein SUGI_0292310 [Cryptomeria japonica]